MSEAAELRLILDQGVPRDAASRLRETELNCLHVGEVGMSMAPDANILTWAIHRNATVITLDADFHTILTVRGASAPSVVRLRMQGLDAIAVVHVVQKVLATFYGAGRRVVDYGQSEQDYCHKLPIGGSVG